MPRSNDLLLQLWSLRCLCFVESGSSITASCVGLGCSRTPPAGTAGKAVPGYNGEIPLVARVRLFICLFQTLSPSSLKDYVLELL